MITPSIDALNKAFGQTGAEGSIVFKMGKGNIFAVEIKNKQAHALISLQGAHLLSWVPRGEDEVVWVSEDAGFAEGKSVRGGVPICWPWFGAHKSSASFPAHGFARTILWDVVSTKLLASGETSIVFKLNTKRLDDSIQQMWPVLTTVEYTLTIGEFLRLELTTCNNSGQDIIIGEALHTYFNVGDVSATQITGLDGKNYLDKPDDFKRKKQVGDIHVDGEVDRVYLQTMDDVIIKNNKRKIRISKQGSQSTVVWNPGEQVADKMGDLGKDGYLQMLCVESANAADDVVTIAAGESHSLRVKYTLEKN